MGAQFNEIALPRELTPDRLKATFGDIQDRDRWENGHSYSGGFGMASGLKITAKEFPDMEAGREYLFGAAQKWEEAIAVTVPSERDPEKKCWLIGAWCSS